MDSSASSSVSTPASLSSPPWYSRLYRFILLPPPVAPDTLYSRGGLVVFCGFLCLFLSSGIMLAMGVIFRALLNDTSLGGDRTSTSWILSIAFAMLNGSGFFGGKLIARIGPRLTALIGATIAAIGFASSSYVTTVTVLYFTYGILIGTGCGLVNQSAVFAVVSHFVKHRAMAVGIAVAGGGVGTLVLGPSLEVVIQNNGWRIALRILALLFGICVPISALPFAVVPIVATQEGVKDNVNNEDETETTKLSITKDMDDDEVTRTKNNSNRKEGSLLEDDHLPATPSIRTVLVTNLSPSSVSSSNAPMEPLVLNPSVKDNNNTTIRKMSNSVTVPSNEDEEVSSSTVKPSKKSNEGTNTTVGKNTQEDHGYLPLRRIRALVLSLIGVSMYSGASFTIVMHAVTFAGEGAPNGPGMLAIQAATLTSYQGIANTIGRVVFGRLADTPGWSRLSVMQIILGISGLCCVGLALSPTNGTYLIFYMVIYGLTAGSVVSTFSSVVGDLVPPKTFAMGLGLANFSQAPVILLAPVLAGWIREITGSYVVVWWGVSVAMFGGSIIMSPTNARLLFSCTVWQRLLRRCSRLSRSNNEGSSSTVPTSEIIRDKSNDENDSKVTK